ncbi:hypothetical protein [Aquibacillus salsiterrae]|uniref:Uncharacterized protein n=1 Tax=Aquibacillus salsiterrae TaxID=2950439 RepID=A0A9X3WH33_9BACI|nr:hypothetical protein [Aquibacillus salsiterrae]MDC3417329.1 hypothetical protein [Aquibacillus salsiterrae]
MSTNNEQPIEQKKKLSTQEIIKQQLERKKQAQETSKGKTNGANSMHRMKSQQSKKTSTTRRKMGS